MKNLMILLAGCAILLATGASAHHPLADIDWDIYLMVDEMIQDTPHADMVFYDMGNPDDANFDITITTTNVRVLESLVDDGLLTYTEELAGNISMTIDFDNGRAVEITISSREE